MDQQLIFDTNHLRLRKIEIALTCDFSKFNYRRRQVIMKLSNTIAVKFKNHMNKGELELGLQLDLDLGQKFRT